MTTNQIMISVELKGRIKDLDTKNKTANVLTASVIFILFLMEKCFLPIEVGDLIYAKCHFKDNDVKSKYFKSCRTSISATRP